ncbi:hypothetical protein ATANTOWER_001591, partial [Ataeniobius toweri]|nr:hypothetical protein [Ataeniobius toweri]
MLWRLNCEVFLCSIKHLRSLVGGLHKKQTQTHSDGMNSCSFESFTASKKFFFSQECPV